MKDAVVIAAAIPTKALCLAVNLSLLVATIFAQTKASTSGVSTPERTEIKRATQDSLRAHKLVEVSEIKELRKVTESASVPVAKVNIR